MRQREDSFPFPFSLAFCCQDLSPKQVKKSNQSLDNYTERLV